MKSFKEHSFELTEAFDRATRIKWESGSIRPDTPFKGSFTVGTKQYVVTLIFRGVSSDKQTCDVMEVHFSVETERGLENSIVKSDDVIQVFATVVSAAQYGASLCEPKQVETVAYNDKDSSVFQKRVSLYRKIFKRYAAQNNYTYSEGVTGGKTKFIMTKKEASNEYKIESSRPDMRNTIVVSPNGSVVLNWHPIDDVFSKLSIMTTGNIPDDIYPSIQNALSQIKDNNNYRDGFFDDDYPSSLDRSKLEDVFDKVGITY